MGCALGTGVQTCAVPIWPQRPQGLVDTGFTELAKRWRPILDAFDEQGVDVCYEIHPGEDVHDGVSYERFLEKVDNHPRACLLYDPSHFVLQCLDCLAYIDHYHERIKAFHVKDRSEEHTSELQSLMRISYAVFCLKKKTKY